MTRLRRLGRLLRLWPGAYFTWPSRPTSTRMVGWMIEDHYMPAVRDQLYAENPLWSILKERS